MQADSVQREVDDALGNLVKRHLQARRDPAAEAEPAREGKARDAGPSRDGWPLAAEGEDGVEAGRVLAHGHVADFDAQVAGRRLLREQVGVGQGVAGGVCLGGVGLARQGEVDGGRVVDVGALDVAVGDNALGTAPELKPGREARGEQRQLRSAVHREAAALDGIAEPRSAAGLEVLERPHAAVRFLEDQPRDPKAGARPVEQALHLSLHLEAVDVEGCAGLVPDLAAAVHDAQVEKLWEKALEHVARRFVLGRAFAVNAGGQLLRGKGEQAFGLGAHERHLLGEELALEKADQARRHEGVGCMEGEAVLLEADAFQGDDGGGEELERGRAGFDAAAGMPFEALEGCLKQAVEVDLQIDQGAERQHRQRACSSCEDFEDALRARRQPDLHGTSRTGSASSPPEGADA